jgi:cytochrome b subunit of formate dehydrogenase
MRYYLRFTPLQRTLHAFMMLSFLGLALSGLPLLFSARPWALALANIFGGVEGAGIAHRICAAVMIVVFVGHVVLVFLKGFASGNVLAILWGPDSMVPQWKDAQDIFGHMRWFLGKGERPRFDRWTYWEKFDYWAVFWGMFIIGGSGLLLWFPQAFAQVVPGWMFNIATLVHGEEALLAVGFIFTIHFFNGHLRPEKFPMDTVVFTGRISEHEMLEERPAEYERLVARNALAATEATPPTRTAEAFGWYVGGATVILGVVTIVLIVVSVVM